MICQHSILIFHPNKTLYGLSTKTLTTALRTHTWYGLDKIRLEYTWPYRHLNLYRLGWNELAHRKSNPWCAGWVILLWIMWRLWCRPFRESSYRNGCNCWSLFQKESNLSQWITLHSRLEACHILGLVAQCDTPRSAVLHSTKYKYVWMRLVT